MQKQMLLTAIQRIETHVAKQWRGIMVNWMKC